MVRTLAVPLTPGARAVGARSGTIVVANTADDSVSLVAAASGRVARSVLVELLPWAIAVDQRQGRIVVLTTAHLLASGSADQVQVLDEQTGRLLHTVAIGTDASAPGLDEHTTSRRARTVTAPTARAHHDHGHGDDARPLPCRRVAVDWAPARHQHS